MPAQPLIVKCPSCGRSVAWVPEQQFKPFCCERCKLIDLGEWAAEEKRIPGPSISSEDNSDDDAFFH
ncbi:MAG: DNA gyrase inhibitor YacG [Methylobacter sp.]